MKIGPKYKIARRLGAPIFEKTQTAKYGLSLARKEKTAKFKRQKSEYGQALNEKQKARFSYGMSERQFKSYVDKAAKAANPSLKLFQLLESRLDNALFRSGLAKTRAQARQLASHGHFNVNGKRVTVPSIQVKVGDVVGWRGSERLNQLGADSAERMKAQAAPAWLEASAEKREATVVGEPAYAKGEQVFDLGTVIGFYNR
ncbi:30S ribosomal protein S4 [Candidatus Parcubacteria bacterium]|nr:30S ribosomal protein S4 [Candidatus Parcubacteria bacterium]